MYIKYVLYCVHLSNWFTDIMAGILDVAYDKRLVRHVLRGERVCIDHLLYPHHGHNTMVTWQIHTMVTTLGGGHI